MIYVNGDSWSQRSNIDPDYSWPCVLQSKAKCQIINQSAGCGSNSRMLSNLHKFYQTDARPKIILIGLTIYSRWHLPSKMGSSWNIGTEVVINDRSGEKLDKILPGYVNHVYDEIEYIYQMYNQIWQMQELATNYFKCPIIFFNSWSSPNNSYHLATMHKEIYKDPTSWIATKVDNINDYSTQDYIHAFNFFKTKLDDWNLVLDTWSDLVYNYIDDEKGLHPGHPSPQGHKIICNNVLDTIEQKYPLLHKELL